MGRAPRNVLRTRASKCMVLQISTHGLLDHMRLFTNISSRVVGSVESVATGSRRRRRRRRQSTRTTSTASTPYDRRPRASSADCVFDASSAPTARRVRIHRSAHPPVTQAPRIRRGISTAIYHRTAWKHVVCAPEGLLAQLEERQTSITHRSRVNTSECRRFEPCIAHISTFLSL